MASRLVPGPRELRAIMDGHVHTTWYVRYLSRHPTGLGRPRRWWRKQAVRVTVSSMFGLEVSIPVGIDMVPKAVGSAVAKLHSIFFIFFHFLFPMEFTRSIHVA